MKRRSLFRLLGLGLVAAWLGWGREKAYPFSHVFKTGGIVQLPPGTITSEDLRRAVMVLRKNDRKGPFYVIPDTSQKWVREYLDV